MQTGQVMASARPESLGASMETSGEETDGAFIDESGAILVAGAEEASRARNTAGPALIEDDGADAEFGFAGASSSAGLLFAWYFVRFFGGARLCGADEDTAEPIMLSM